MAACEPTPTLVQEVEKSGPEAFGKIGQQLRLEEVSVGGFNSLFVELSDICIIFVWHVIPTCILIFVLLLTLSVHAREGYNSLTHSFIHSLCQQRISKMADFYALREVELDDDLSCHFF